jgi:hypothetical protein
MAWRLKNKKWNEETRRQEAPMETKGGELVRSKLDGKPFKVNRVSGEEWILESENGLCQTWFGRWDLELFFEKAGAI